MIRNFKALGLVFVAVFALSAAAASSASAFSKFTTATDATTITSEALTEQVFTAGGSPVECEEVNVDVTVGTETGEITAEPNYNNAPCFALGFQAKIDMNGCAYKFTAVGSVHIECPQNVEIVVTVKNPLTGKFVECIRVHEQTPTTPTVTYTNSAAGVNPMDVKITAEVEGITYQKVGICGNAEGNDAVYEGEVTVFGEAGGVGKDVTVS